MVVVAALLVVAGAAGLGVVAALLVVGAETSFSVAADEALRFAGPALALTCAATALTARGVTSLPFSAEMKLVVEPPDSLPEAESTLFSRQARPSADEHADPPFTTNVLMPAALSVLGCATLENTFPSIRAWAPL